MAATAMSEPAAPRDRDTLWKMHVHRAVTAGASTVCRPFDARGPAVDIGRSSHCRAHGERAHSNGYCAESGGEARTDAAFVQIALDVLDDRGVLCARVAPSVPATVEMGPHRIDVLWGPTVDHALATAMASAPLSLDRPDQPPPTAVVEVDTIYAACCKDLPAYRRDFASLGPRAQTAFHALIIARADSLSLCATQAGPLAYGLVRRDTTTAGGVGADDPDREDPIYGGPGIGWALLKAYAVAIAVIIPLAMALCMGGD